MRIGRVILPTGISLAIHAALLGLVALATWTVVRPPSRSMPTVELSLSGSPVEPVAQPSPAPPDRVEPGSAEAPSLADVVSLLTLPARATPPPSSPMLMPRASGRPERAIRLAPGGAASGPASFAGVTSRRAASVVFVVDCSGSMVSAMSIVLEELGRSIERLAPDQRFAIIPFRGSNSAAAPATFPPRLTLVPATDANLRDARAFLRTIVTEGRSDPLAGLIPALTLKPEAVFFLARSIPRTEGTWGGGEAAILAELDRLNPEQTRRGVRARPTQINAVQFLQHDPTGIMQAIGSVHGRGTSGYTLVTLEQLGRAGLANAPSARAIATDLDRAEAVLTDLASDASDITLLLGFPTSDQTDRVRRAARLALDLVDQASAALGISEDGVTGGDDPRIVLLGARAALLLAASEPSHEFRAALLERAARAVTLLEADASAPDEAAPIVQSDLARALVLSTWALAYGLRDEPPDAEVRFRLQALMRAEPSLASASLELVLAPLFVERGQSAQPATIDWNAPPFRDEAGHIEIGAVLLSCDAATRSARMPGAIERADLPPPVDAPYASFLKLPDPSGAHEAIVRKRLIHLRTLPPRQTAGEPLEQLDTLLASLPGATGTSALDLSTLDGMLRDLVSLSQPLGAELVLDRAHELIAKPEADSHALNLGSLLASVAGDATLRDATRERAWEARLIAASRLLERSPSEPAIEELIRLLGSSESSALAPSTREAASLMAVSALTVESREPRWSDARAYDLLATISASSTARHAAYELATRLEARFALLASTDRDLDRHLVTMRRSIELSRGLGFLPNVRTLEAVARALVELGSDEAIHACADLLAHPNVATTEQGREGAAILAARAQINADDHAAALGILVPLARAMPEPGPMPARIFWEAWTLTLETMIRAEPQRQQEAHAHTVRLGLIDEQLGGEPWASRIRAVASR
ncbi:MAG: hypothetical protein KF838_02635 [Phycisphaeraceae bacterium]|nr:MAG: hypothetical protein KF838_02635 [Phycisphaeraceae bacterium]